MLVCECGPCLVWPLLTSQHVLFLHEGMLRSNSLSVVVVLLSCACFQREFILCSWEHACDPCMRMFFFHGLCLLEHDLW